MSGADLANLLNEAALIAVRREATVIAAEDLDNARDRVLLGVRRSSLVLTPAERHVVAYHEAGHAVLASVLPGADPVHKVTILPLGMALGATEQVPIEEHQFRRRAELDDALAVRLGGRAAEQLVFGEMSTGRSDDLVQRRANSPAGWSASGACPSSSVTWPGPRRERVFLGEDLIHTRDYSDETAKIIDEEVVRILEEQAQRAMTVLQQSRQVLDAISSRSSNTGGERKGPFAQKSARPATGTGLRWFKTPWPEACPPRGTATQAMATVIVSSTDQLRPRVGTLGSNGRRRSAGKRRGTTNRKEVHTWQKQCEESRRASDEPILRSVRAGVRPIHRRALAVRRPRRIAGSSRR